MRYMAVSHVFPGQGGSRVSVAILAQGSSTFMPYRTPLRGPQGLGCSFLVAVVKTHSQRAFLHLKRTVAKRQLAKRQKKERAKVETQTAAFCEVSFGDPPASSGSSSPEFNPQCSVLPQTCLAPEHGQALGRSPAFAWNRTSIERKYFTLVMMSSTLLVTVPSGRNALPRRQTIALHCPTSVTLKMKYHLKNRPRRSGEGR